MVAGAVVIVTFNNGTNVQGTITLNVNSTGAKNVAPTYINDTLQKGGRAASLFAYTGSTYAAVNASWQGNYADYIGDGG